MALALALPATAAEPFRFEAQASLDEMRELIRRDFSGDANREQVRAVFVGQGKATLKPHPKQANVEKYIYDIDLCSYYVWRWNISADYAANGRLKQLYVNAEPVLGNAARPGPPKRGPYFGLARPRPQAFKGESTLMATISDRDGNAATAYDQELLLGLGPTRVDPVDMGKAHPYRGEVWRSIFDPDEAAAIAPYAGDCAPVDAKMTALKAAAGLPPPPPPPAAMTEAAIDDWLRAHIRSEGWTLIAMEAGGGVTFGGPDGVSRLADGTLRTLIRNEYFKANPMGGMEVRSVTQTWNVDCAGRRFRFLDMTIHAENNLAGRSQTRTFDAADWTAVPTTDSLRARVVKRVCEAPTTGQRLR